MGRSMALKTCRSIIYWVFSGNRNYTLPEQEKADTRLMQLKMDNGPESSGRRTQFLSRMVQLADAIHKPIQLLYYPPYHSKYNPIERCWGILELQWNGTKLTDAETMLEWAKNMTWKGMRPVVELSRKAYAKGISLGKAAMQALQPLTPSCRARHDGVCSWRAGMEHPAQPMLAQVARGMVEALTGARAIAEFIGLDAVTL